MVAKVFIDGEVGTTGLQIRARLGDRSDIALVSLAEDRRKDPSARADAFAEADIGILCLPDAASKEAAVMCENLPTRLIDASTAFRTDPAWVFGFPEMTAGHRAKVASARNVSNPGCWSTCAIALIRPLTQAGLLPGDILLNVFGISGYTGGGKAMIAEFESGATTGSFTYATRQAHKHLPEITAHGGLSNTPVMVPSVGQYAQGMVVHVPLHLGPLGVTAAQLREALAAHYSGEAFIRVLPESEVHDRDDPTRLNGTNMLELAVQGDLAAGRVTLTAVLDNLGKGASGAAVQNMNLMLGLPENAGL